MSSEEPYSTAESASPAPAEEERKPAAAPPRRKHWSNVEVWMLGAFSVIGLIGFIATFVLIIVRTPGAPVQRTLSATEIQHLVGPKGERGPAGPAGQAGARGPAGDPGVRLVRSDCAAGNCTAECAGDEILLSAYCSPSRSPVAYPTEHSAACRSLGGRARVEVVAACIKAARR
jgi:hypothetical protein